MGLVLKQILFFVSQIGQLMSIESLPKATVVRFIKQNTTLEIQQQYLQILIDLSNQYLRQVADMANYLCERQNRIQITPRHLEMFYIEHDCGIEDKLGELQEMCETITSYNKQKIEESKLLKERIYIFLREQRQMKKLQKQRQAVAAIQTFDELQRAAKVKDQFEFNYQEVEEQKNNSPSKIVIVCDDK